MCYAKSPDFATLCKQSPTVSKIDVRDIMHKTSKYGDFEEQSLWPWKCKHSIFIKPGIAIQV